MVLCSAQRFGGAEAGTGSRTCTWACGLGSLPYTGSYTCTLGQLARRPQSLPSWGTMNLQGSLTILSESRQQGQHGHVSTQQGRQSCPLGAVPPGRHGISATARLAATGNSRCSPANRASGAPNQPRSRFWVGCAPSWELLRAHQDECQGGASEPKLIPPGAPQLCFLGWASQGAGSSSLAFSLSAPQTTPSGREPTCCRAPGREGAAS